MLLHEEYILRHRLKVPIINYDSKSFVFLHRKSCLSDGLPDWRIFFCGWRSCENHPGNFEISYYQPVQYNHLSEYFAHIASKKKIFWDQYENYILGFVNDLRGEYLAAPVEDNHFMAWKILLYMCDSYLAKKMTKELSLLIERSIDPTLGYEERQRVLLRIERFLPEEVIDQWKHEVLVYASIGSRWLVNLINE